jgi:DNA-binding NarL/FixJ family response regulator
MALRIALVDREKNTHLAVAEAIQTTEPQWLLDGYDNVYQAILGMRACRPDVVLLRLDEQDRSRVAPVRKLKALWPALPIILLTSRADSGVILAPLMAGAIGCMMKPLALADLVRAINDAAHGLPHLCPDAQQALLACLQGGNAIHGLGRLSRREGEVLGCLVEGLSDKEIAERLGVQLSTVNSLSKRLFRKLNVHNRGGAANRVSKMRLCARPKRA